MREMEQPSGALLEIPLDDLIFYERTGGGTFGTVYRSLWRSQNLIVAVKRLLVLEKEAQVLSLVSHKNIIKFHGAVNKDPDFCLVTEYAPNGSLFAYLRNPENTLDFRLIVRWATEIAKGVHYLHWESPIKIIHRDLKSKNVVISEDWVCKLCDFGASRFAVNTTKMTLAGTFPWMSPEAIQSLTVSEATDVWSYGVVLWELLTKEVPFNGIEGFQVAWLIVEKGQRLTIPTTCPPSFRKLLERCWQMEPKQRPNLKQILALLQAMLQEESLPELTNSFLDHKMVWTKEIQATLDQLKKAELAISNKEQELMEREMKLKEREKSLVHHLNIVKLEDHDINTWRDVDVYQWIMQLRKAGHTSDLAQYADLFLTNHITGRRMMSVTGEHLQEMGIFSVGHRMDLLHEIEILKTHNFRLLNFPPLAKNAETVATPNILTKETVSMVLIFGHHLRKGLTDDDTKWKMYLEIDQDEDDDTAVLTLVKEVTFICTMPDFGTFTLTHPPFIMSTWCLGVTEEMTVECVVTYEPFVEKPKSTRYVYQVNGRNPTSQQQAVVLTLHKHNQKPSPADNSASLASIPVSPARSNASFSVSSNVNPSSLHSVWTKSFHPVQLPPPRVPEKTDMWSSIVSGKRPSVAKPIPGTTGYINDYPFLARSNSNNSKSSTGKSKATPSSDPISNETQGSVNIAANAGNIHNSDSLLSNASKNTESLWTIETQNISSKISGGAMSLSSGNTEGNKGQRPLSAGEREKNGKQKRLMFEQEERPWVGRQVSQHTRSMPNRTRTDFMANPQYRRAFSGGPVSSNIVNTGTGNWRNRNSKGNQPRQQRDCNKQYNNHNNFTEDRGTFQRGKEGNRQEYWKQKQNNNNRMNGDDGDLKWRKGNGGKSGNRNDKKVKAQISKDSSITSVPEEDGWMIVGKKK